MNQPELWRSVPGFPAYVVSNRGRIANRATGQLKIIDARGRVTLYHEGWKTGRLATRIHRTVWTKKS